MRKAYEKPTLTKAGDLATLTRGVIGRYGDWLWGTNTPPPDGGGGGGS